MMLRTLFDERRRSEIRDAIKSGAPIAFRGKAPALEVPATRNPFQGLSSTIEEDVKEAFQKAMGKPMESATIAELMKFAEDCPKGRPVAFDDIARSSKPPVIAGSGWGVPRKDRGGNG